jgi:two-component system cell cycle sensor histidine kinase/response regulator CckA
MGILGPAMETEGMKAKRIILLEDETGVRRFIWDVLTNAGYEVTQVASGEEAQWLLEDSKDPADLLIADVVMQGMSGPAFARWLEEKHPTTRVLFVSGFPRETAEKFGLPLGGVNILPKPFTARDLLRSVGDILG